MSVPARMTVEVAPTWLGLGLGLELLNQGNPTLTNPNPNQAPTSFARALIVCSIERKPSTTCAGAAHHHHHEDLP